MQPKSANAYQVGGSHYKTSYEHWDLVLNTGMGYLEGCATKYVSRFQKKGGLDDLRKSLHYIYKIKESIQLLAPRRRPNRRFIQEQCFKFFDANNLQGPECNAILCIAQWETESELDTAAQSIHQLMDRLEAVPLTEENHHAERAESEHSPSGWPGGDGHGH